MSLRDKIGYTEETSIDYKQAMWKLLIASGGVVQVEETQRFDRTVLDPNTLVDINWSYYGGHPEHMPVELTIQALQTLESGINWEQTNVPSTGRSAEFNGTFTSSQYYVQYLCGLLVPNEGDISLWWAEGSEFDYVLRQITQQEITLEDAIEDTKRRLESVEEYPDHWVYTCKI